MSSRSREPVRVRGEGRGEDELAAGGGERARRPPVQLGRVSNGGGHGSARATGLAPRSVNVHERSSRDPLLPSSSISRHASSGVAAAGGPGGRRYSKQTGLPDKPKVRTGSSSYNRATTTTTSSSSSTSRRLSGTSASSMSRIKAGGVSTLTDSGGDIATTHQHASRSRRSQIPTNDSINNPRASSSVLDPEGRASKTTATAHSNVRTGARRSSSLEAEDEAAVLERVFAESRAESERRREAVQAEGLSEEEAVARVVAASREEEAARAARVPASRGESVVAREFGLSAEEEALARAIEASTREHLAAAAAADLRSGSGNGERSRVVEADDEELARAIEASLKSAAAVASSSSSSHTGGPSSSSRVARRSFMDELDAREREMRMEDATAGGLVSALHGLQGDMSEEEALKMALHASRHQLEQHAVLAQGEAAIQKKAREQPLHSERGPPHGGLSTKISRAASTGNNSSNGGGRSSSGSGSGSRRGSERTRSEELALGGRAGKGKAVAGVASQSKSASRASRGDGAAALAAQQASMYAAQLGLHDNGNVNALPEGGMAMMGASAGSRPPSRVASDEEKDAAAAAAVEGRLIQEDQDAEYEASLAADRAKEAALERARREAADAAAEAHRAQAEAARRVVEARERLSALRDALAAGLPPEPAAVEGGGGGGEGCCEVAVDVAPLGKRVVRRFDRASPCSTVYDYVRLVVAEAALEEASAEEDSQAVQLTQSGEFELVQNFAPRPLPNDATTLASYGVARRDKFIVRAGKA